MMKYMFPILTQNQNEDVISITNEDNLSKFNVLVSAIKTALMINSANKSTLNHAIINIITTGWDINETHFISNCHCNFKFCLCR